MSRFIHTLQRGFSWRKLFLGSVLFFSLLFLFLKIAELQTVFSTIQQGDWHFILLAVAVESIWMISVALVYHYIYLSFGIDESVRKLFQLSSAANFINVVAPSGMGGWAVMISRARQKGYSQTGAVVSGFLFVLFDYFSFLCILAVGLLILFEQQDLEMAELAASGFLLVLALGLFTFIYLGTRSVDRLSRSFTWIARLVNRLSSPVFHRDLLSEERAVTFAGEAATELQMIRQKPSSLLVPMLLTLWTKVLLVGVMFLMFLSFNVSFSAGTLIAGFSMGYLFMIVSPTPSGVGVIEGTLPLVLNSLHVPLSSAAVVALAYRGVTFWLPLFIGMLAFQRLSKRKKILPA